MNTLRSKFYGLALLVSVICCSSLYGQTTAKQTRILFLVDESSSMLEKWSENEIRNKTANRLISAIMDSLQKLNPTIEFSLRVFGSQYPSQDKNCTDTRLEVPFGKYSNVLIANRLSFIRPQGFSPIAYSLKRTALEDFVQSEKYNYSIILITDGGESCDGDICVVMEELLLKKISFTPYILSLVEYAALNQLYECLGKYMTITQNDDIPKVIKTIINDNLPLLTGIDVPRSPIELPKKTPVVVPQELVAETPPAPVKTRADLTLISRNTKLIGQHKFEATYVPRELAYPAPVQLKWPEEQVVPQKPTTPKLSTITTKRSFQKMNFTALPVPKIVKLPNTKVTGFKVVEEPQKPVTPKLNRISSNTRLQRMNLLFLLPVYEPIKLPNTKLIGFKVPEETPPPPPRVTPPPSNPQRNTPPASNTIPDNIAGIKKQLKDTVNVPYQVVEQESKTTEVEVYLTDGAGKFYRSSPLIRFTDVSTQKQQSFIRGLDSKGNPKPITIAAGTYEITIPKGRTKLQNVKITPNKLNKVFIVVQKGSLGFEFAGTKKGTMENYRAHVSSFLNKSDVTTHPGDKILQYEPGNYHIEINTLPPSLYNLDITGNEISILQIPQPGTVQITNETPLGRAQFLYMKGQQYLPFYTMNITGDVNSQKEEFLPGLYKVQFPARSENGQVVQKTINFRITGNAITKLELN